MKKITNSIVLLSFLLFSIKILGGNSAWVKEDIFNNNTFIKNEGQYHSWFNPTKKILYAIDNGFDQFQFTNTSFEANVLHREEGKMEEKHETKKEGDGTKYRMLVVSMEWVGANPNARIEAFDKKLDYFTYVVQDKTTDKFTGVKADGYNKLICYDLYPGIDVEYTFEKNKGGFKYSLIIHPGADLKKVRLRYSGKDFKELIEQQSSGNLIAQLKEKEYIQEHTPTAWHKNTRESVKCGFKLHGNEIEYYLQQLIDTTQTIVFDPWLTSSLSNLTQTQSGYDVNYDNAGNLYVFGGTLNSKVAKYDSNGNLLWTFNGTVTSEGWSSSTSYNNGMQLYTGIFGNFITNNQSGKVYVSQGFAVGGTRTVRLDPNGIYDNFITSINSNYQETWDFLVDCSSGELYGLGGGLTSSLNLGIIDTSSGATSVSNITGISGTAQDIMNGALDEQGNAYVIFVSSSGGTLFVSNRIYKINASFNGNIWNTSTGLFAFSEKNNKSSYAAGMPFSNGFNALYANKNYLYYYDGRHLQAYNKTNGSLVVPTYTISTLTKRKQGGIYVDDCDNIYIGGVGEIKVYHFNGFSFNLVGNVPLGSGANSNHVYDIKYLASTNLLFVSGEKFVGTYVPVYSSSCVPSLKVEATLNCFGVAQANVISSITNPNLTYIWKDSTGATIATTTNTSLLTNSISGVSYGIYYVSVQQNPLCNGPISIDTTSLVNTLSISVKATQPDLGKLNGSAEASVVVNSGNAPYSFIWSTSETSQSISGLPPGTYSLSVIDSFGCWDTLSFILIVDDEFTFYVPNSFTPNYDYINDTWKPLGEHIDEQSYSLMVFDRWGIIVFSTGDFNKSWDGKTKQSIEAPIGTYIWKAKIKPINSIEKIEKIGRVSIIR